MTEFTVKKSLVRPQLQVLFSVTRLLEALGVMGKGKRQVSGEKWSRLRDSVQLIAECVLYASILGIAMDLVTAHLAPDYFIMKEPKLTQSREPLILALVWGVGASWWFGALAGFLLALQNWLRKVPLPLGVIRPRLVKACAFVWLTLMILLGTFYGLIGLLPEDVRRPTFDLDRRMMSVALTHLTEYIIGLVAIVIVMVQLRRLAEPLPDAPSP